jgi:serine/threonine protein kinase
MGTFGYMSPEQVRGQDADHRADIFSFGVILYEMLSGRRTFSGDSAIVGGTSYTVTAAGDRFLFVTAREEAASLQFTVVVNWTAEARK